MQIVPILHFRDYPGQTAVHGNSGRKYGDTKRCPEAKCQVFPLLSSATPAKIDEWIALWPKACTDILNLPTIVSRPHVTFAVLGDVVTTAAIEEQATLVSEMQERLDLALKGNANLEASLQKEFLDSQKFQSQAQAAEAEVENLKRQMTNLEQALMLAQKPVAPPAEPVQVVDPEQPAAPPAPEAPSGKAKQKPTVAKKGLPPAPSPAAE